MYPCLMFVGNNIINGNPVGKQPQKIVRFANGRYYAENGYSWKHGIKIN